MTSQPNPGIDAGDDTDADGRTLLERLDDRIAAVNPDVWLCACLIAVFAPWLSNLI